MHSYNHGLVGPEFDRSMKGNLVYKSTTWNFTPLNLELNLIGPL